LTLTAAEARERIRAQADLNAFISLTDENGEGPIVAIKDLVDVKGTVTTAGSPLMPRVRAAQDAPVVRRLREHGCVMIGKANLHEWAFGVDSQNPHFGGVRNPRARDRIPGGSSGGSGAAVAAGLCDWAVGSDTGGSIRVPAGFCGVVGFKPTIGTIETEGVVPLSRSLDTLGPLAPDVRSAAVALEMMSGLTGLIPDRARPLPELRIAVPEGWDEGLSPEVTEAWRRAAAGLPRIRFPDRGWMGNTGTTILYAEAAAFHRDRFAEHPDLFGADVRARLEEGLRLSRSEYVQALLEQSRVRLEAEAAMSGWDAILAPLSRVLPPRLGASYQRADLTGYTRPFNTTGQPVIALPLPVEGVPIGVQVVGHFGHEANLVEVAMAFEAAWA
jgi:aspartyl-tRNA(Asn)/glutamyl-tRNA(Gln) amidotransferase subunit A